MCNRLGEINVNSLALYPVEDIAGVETDSPNLLDISQYLLITSLVHAHPHILTLLVASFRVLHKCVSSGFIFQNCAYYLTKALWMCVSEQPTTKTYIDYELQIPCTTTNLAIAVDC